MLTPAMLGFVVLTIRMSTIDFLIGLVHCRYHRPTGGAALAVELEKGEFTFTELNPWFLINALAEEAIICIKDPFQITSASPVNINNHLSSNATSTNSSLHTNLFVNPRSTFLNFAVFNSRSVRNKIESIIDHIVEKDIGLCTVTETWLNDADSVSIVQLSVAGYFFKNFSRQSQNRGGGTGILFRDPVNVSLERFSYDLEMKTSEQTETTNERK